MPSSAPAPTEASAPWSWTAPVTRRIFGIVPDEAVRRHPSDLVRVGVAAFIIVVTAVLARHLTQLEKAGYDLVVSIPDSAARRAVGASTSSARWSSSSV